MRTRPPAPPTHTCVSGSTAWPLASFSRMFSMISSLLASSLSIQLARTCAGMAFCLGGSTATFGSARSAGSLSS